MRRTRILVADPSPMFRSGMRALLVRESNFEVVPVANLPELLEAIALDCPDIALVDLDLPPGGGVEAVDELAERCSCHTIVWSFAPSKETVLQALMVGAIGYLDKRTSPRGLVRALVGISRGEAPLSRGLASLMIEALHESYRREQAKEQAAVLSIRECEVLALVAKGARNRQIAAELVISEFTVKRHLQNIFHKLDLPSRREAATFYRAAFGPDRESVAVGHAR